MSLQQKDNAKYEFQMPKFWDFTNSIPQKRPDESWFCVENVSGPSFPSVPKKRRRPLRVKHALNKTIESHKNQHAAKAPPVPEKPMGNVFDRLSTHSTISASKKMHPHLAVEKGRPTPKPHTTQQKHSTSQATVPKHDEQYQLDQETIAEPVADRIARIEKELALSNNAPFKRSNSNEQASSQPSKIQKIINAQFSSSSSSSLSSKQDIPRSRTTTTAKNTTITNTTAKHTTQIKPTLNTTPTTQPAPKQPSPVTQRRSLYNELHLQKTVSTQQNEKVRSSTPMPSKAARPSLTNRRSLYHELQLQNKSPSVPVPLFSSQPQAQLPSPSLASSPPPQHDMPMREPEPNCENDDTATSDFFEDLLRARREKAKAQSQPDTKAKTNAPANDYFGSLLKSSHEKYKNHQPRSPNITEEEPVTAQSSTNFFDSLLKSTQEKYKNYQSRSPNIVQEEPDTAESTTNIFSNLLINNEKQHTIKPIQQQNKENVAVSHSNLDTLSKSSQPEKHKQQSSLHTSSQTNQEDGGEPSRAPSIDKKQQANYKLPSVSSHTAIAITDQLKENLPESVPANTVLPPPSRPTQTYAKSSKQKYTFQEDRYFIDERIAKAKKTLRESKQRTRKWLDELSANQPMQH